MGKSSTRRIYKPLSTAEPAIPEADITQQGAKPLARRFGSYAAVVSKTQQAPASTKSSQAEKEPEKKATVVEDGLGHDKGISALEPRLASSPPNAPLGPKVLGPRLDAAFDRPRTESYPPPTPLLAKASHGDPGASQSAAQDAPPIKEAFAPPLEPSLPPSQPRKLRQRPHLHAREFHGALTGGNPPTGHRASRPHRPRRDADILDDPDLAQLIEAIQTIVIKTFRDEKEKETTRLEEHGES